MRIIIVEDEPRIRAGIVKIIKKHSDHEVLDAYESGEKALPNILAQKPDLLISDIRMGGMDGLSLIEQVQQAGLNISFILLTGYADFEYARKAIQFNVIDYLLKPLTVDELLSALSKAEQKIMETEQLSTQDIIKQIETQLERAISIGEAKWTSLESSLGITYNVQATAEHTMCLFNLSSVDQESYRWVSNYLRNKMNSLFIDRTITLDMSEGIICLILDSSQNAHLERMLERYVLSEVNQSVRCSLSLTRFKGIQNIREAYNNCKTISAFQLLKPEGSIVTAAWVETIEQQDLPYPSDMEEELKRAVFSRRYNAFSEFLTLFDAWIKDQHYHPDVIKSHCSQLLCSVCAMAEEFDPTINGRINYREIVSAIEHSLFESDLKVVLQATIDHLSHQNTSAKQIPNILVTRAIRIIADKYRENITMCGVAEQLQITPEYLSGLFRKEMGINFMTFLRNFRLSHAKRLLSDSDLRIQDVAEASGFKDPQYFSKIFKEVFAITPNEYRQKLIGSKLDNKADGSWMNGVTDEGH